MVYKYLLVFCLFLAGHGFAQTAAPNMQSKQWNQTWAKFSNGKWMQKTEVTNAEFRAFLDEVKQNGNLDGYYAYYPDSTGWSSISSATAPFEVHYFSNPVFDNFPVVNISYEAAVAYCQWLTHKYANQSNKAFGNVSFRLPTREEWMLAARGGKGDGRPYPWKGEELRDKKNQKLANFRDEGNIGTITLPTGINERTFVTSPVNSFLANEIGLFCMSGNVAEMVAEKGVAVGGSYLENENNIRIESKKEVKGVSADVGFRVIVVSQ
jgi:formylglycine-generating enzyme required for sulfatase activity